ncbi:unnamed protein product, partial [Nesidiocoris tenuis]
MGISIIRQYRRFYEYSIDSYLGVAQLDDHTPIRCDARPINLHHERAGAGPLLG